MNFFFRFTVRVNDWSSLKKELCLGLPGASHYFRRSPLYTVHWNIFLNRSEEFQSAYTIPPINPFENFVDISFLESKQCRRYLQESHFFLSVHMSSADFMITYYLHRYIDISNQNRPRWTQPSHGEIPQKWWNLKEQSMTCGLDLKTWKNILIFMIV